MAVVAVAGDVDLTYAEDLRTAIEDAQVSRERIAIDVSAATMIDSRVIGVLVATAERLEGPLPLIDADSNIRRLLATVGLDSHFAFIETAGDLSE